jgi:hypothetical protein
MTWSILADKMPDLTSTTLQRLCGVPALTTTLPEALAPRDAVQHAHAKRTRRAQSIHVERGSAVATRAAARRRVRELCNTVGICFVGAA